MIVLHDNSLPEPSVAARRLSETLAARIRDEIETAGGCIGFDRFMARALYEPGLGYYSAGSIKLGVDGDFVTAPELGNTLAECIAASAEPWLAALESPIVLELGAGTGRLAGDLLAALDARGLECVRYCILEPSADLRARQSAALEGFGRRVQWLEELPAEPIEGLILANEVADALPVARFVKRDGAVKALGVGVDEGRFVWRESVADEALTAKVRDLEHRLGRSLPNGYRSELCPMLDAWIASRAACLGRGALLLIDYGMVRREYYHEQRVDGTLVCHYRQRALDDPFVRCGLQDISAWVDFSAVADAAARAGLELAAFTTQGSFLLESLPAIDPERLGLDEPRKQSALKTLVLPGEMGERFKLMLLARGIDVTPLPGRDFRNRLQIATGRRCDC